MYAFLTRACVSAANDKATGSASWSEFTHGAGLRRLLVGVGLQVGQQMSGINSIMFFAPSIFKSVGFHGSEASLLADGINGVVNFLATFLAFGLMDRFGRRKLLLWGAASMGAAMALLATLGYVFKEAAAGDDDDTGISLSSTAAGYSCALCIYFFVLSFAYSWGPVVWALCTEIFPTAQRAKGVSLTTTTNWVFTLIIGQFVPVLQTAVDFGIFLIFAGCCVFMWFFVLLCVPETKGVSIDEVSALFDKPEAQPKQGRGGMSQPFLEEDGGGGSA